MKIGVIGAGAVGGSIGGRLAAAGAEVTFIDSWPEHVAAIDARGLTASGVPSAVHARGPAFLPENAPPGLDLALIATDTNGTEAAAALAASLLTPHGYVLTVQNGIGNVERLRAAMGADRVLGGSTMCSFRTVGPGHVEQTHMGLTTIGELDGSQSPRVGEVAQLLRGGGYEVAVSADIMADIWTKFALNCAINALAATSGLRSGEISRLPAMDQLQDRIMDEIFAVIRAKDIDVGETVLRAKIKAQCRLKYNRPSMLQHIEAGRRTEIDALNGALLREAAALGLPAPYNTALVALLKGREFAQMRKLHEPDEDYAALEAAADREAGA